MTLYFFITFKDRAIMKGGKTMIKNAKDLSIKNDVFTTCGTDFVCPVASATSMDYNYDRVVEAYSIYLKLLNIITKNYSNIRGKIDINSFQEKAISITC